MSRRTTLPEVRRGVRSAFLACSAIVLLATACGSADETMSTDEAAIQPARPEEDSAEAAGADEVGDGFERDADGDGVNDLVLLDVPSAGFALNRGALVLPQPLYEVLSVDGDDGFETAFDFRDEGYQLGNAGEVWFADVEGLEDPILVGHPSRGHSCSYLGSLVPIDVIFACYEAPEIEMISVLAFSVSIPACTPGVEAAGDLVQLSIPSEARPDDRVVDASEIHGLIAVVDIPMNLPLVRELFQDPAGPVADAACNKDSP